MQSIYYFLMFLLCITISGCSRYAQPATPAEAEVQEEKMREWLKNSSPRATNQLPKAVPEFQETFSTSGPKKAPSIPEEGSE